LLSTRLVDRLKRSLASNLGFPLSRSADHWQFERAQGGVEWRGEGMGEPAGKQRTEFQRRESSGTWEPMTNEAMDVSRQERWRVSAQTKDRRGSIQTNEQEWFVESSREQKGSN